MLIFEGGISYTELRDMPLPEVGKLHAEAIRIAEAQRRAMKR